MLHNAAFATGLSFGADLQMDGGHEAERLAAWTSAWHDRTSACDHDGGLLQTLHRANFDLWHNEDLARDPDATDAAIANVKRSIDRLNQQRNDAVEQMDVALLTALTEQRQPAPDAHLHSETPGMMLDRLSILSLKIFHTREQAERTDASAQHSARSSDRLHVLEEQSADLSACLTSLWTGVLAGTRRFKLYRQMKMYNDPEFNPVLYGRADAGPGT